MKKPQTHKDWAEESFAAFEEAREQLREGKAPVDNIYELFRLAPMLASINRKINGTMRGTEMLSVIEDLEEDFKVDDEAKDKYLFNFIFSYIHSHIYSDLLDDMEADRIMGYINDNYDLFADV